MENCLLPKEYKIISVEKKTEIEWLFRVEFDSPVQGGQFIQVSIPRVGEAPISVSAFDNEAGWVEFLIRKVGKVTDVIFDLKAGDSLFLRGPYGNVFPLEQYKGKHLVVVAGGSGLAPVRPIINHFYENDNSANVDILIGFKDENSIIFHDEINKWKSKFNTIITLDRACSLDGVCEGLVTQYIPYMKLANDFDNMEVVIVGPPAMMKYSTLEFLRRGVPKDKIWVSFERKMSCAVGKCGHCKIDETYVCLEGPVFRYDKAETLFD
ncbi:MAG: anaerobic sulfite reductase subunit [Fusobacteriaceae bacterium]|jgi:anaerobic sulfite reductase subunit B|nr:sulfite reductase, subunit [Fusobacteriales bacterium]MDN5303371.1 anaerobic sulfite reductase subunit [Fusobacteriaceae bacterium]